MDGFVTRRWHFCRYTGRFFGLSRQNERICALKIWRVKKTPYICGMKTNKTTPIGIFDSGYGGLSIFREIHRLLPGYDYIYLGDNKRAPYGDRSFDEVFDFTKQAVNQLFDMGCPLIVLACNTASAKALRNIQQRVLPYSSDPTRRVLGVVRPTVERIGQLTYSGHIGVIATQATISSQSYDMELEKIPTTLRLDFKPLVVNSVACPRWVPMIESGLQNTPQMYQAVHEDLSALLDKDPDIDAIILGCTHYPLITSLIQKVLQDLEHPEIILMPQGKPVAYALQDYLRRHPEMDERLTKNLLVRYYTTGDAERFEKKSSVFLSNHSDIKVETLTLG